LVEDASVIGCGQRLASFERTQNREALSYHPKEFNSVRAGKTAHTSTEERLVKLQSQKSVSGLVILLFVTCCSLLSQESKSQGGAAIFKAKCVVCHGANGSGNTPLGKQLQAADLHSKDVQKLSDAELRKTVHDGQANMPAFADQLSDEEISQVVKYVRQLGKTSSAKKN
jgi:cytochrome c553